MFFYRFNRGPRGRMFGHRGSPVGMILAIFGLISLAPVALAVLSGLFVGFLGVVGGLVAVAASVLSSLGSEVVAGGSVLVGILIGLLLYRSIHAWKVAAREEKEESAPAAKKTDEKKAEEKEEEYYPTDTYRSYGA